MAVLVMLLGAIAGMVVHHAHALALDFERLRIRLGQRFVSEQADRRFQEWQQLIGQAQELSTPDKLQRVNEFFNRRIQFGEDAQIWGQSDYWATPLETLGKGQGDCEDFTIAKYFTLRALGVNEASLRMIYVKARIGGATSPVQQAHMVLVFYPEPTAEPLVLDNLLTEIRPAGRRPDLLPVFSFNTQGIWQGISGSTQGGAETSRLSRWQDALQRIRAEGFD